MSRFNKPITGKKDEKGLMQVEIFPQRTLNVETAQKLLDELNEIRALAGWSFTALACRRKTPTTCWMASYGAVETKYLNIKGEKVELTVQIGRIWIEIDDAGVIEKIRAAGEKALPFPFEMYEGIYIRTQPTVVDYARRRERRTTSASGCSIRRIGARRAVAPRSRTTTGMSRHKRCDWTRWGYRPVF